MDYSFIVIAYNEAANIGRTVRAIVAQQGLQHEPANYEVVIVNDGSTDTTLHEINALHAEFPAVRAVDLQPNQGRGAARAAGLAAARGTLLAFVDADIILPFDWLTRCLPYIKTYDACGGTAVPDGDVAFVHRLLKLAPKVASHSTTVTGSNGLFRRLVFEKIAFDPAKRNGEDVDLGYKIAAAKLKTVTVPGLLVEHYETKSFVTSLAWLGESGRGASRQFHEHMQVRLPDLAFFGFVFLLIAAIVATIVQPSLWWPAINSVILYLFASSTLHLHGKFYLERTPWRSIQAIVINMSLLAAYYGGRIVGHLLDWKKK